MTTRQEPIIKECEYIHSREQVMQDIADGKAVYLPELDGSHSHHSVETEFRCYRLSGALLVVTHTMDDHRNEHWSAELFEVAATRGSGPTLACIFDDLKVSFWPRVRAFEA